MSILKPKFMQTLEEKLISECKTQIWARNQIHKPILEVEKINPYSISSVKQKLKK